jgi:hypothetical protein
VVEAYLVWVLLVGIAIGGALTWFLVGRLPRRSDDVSPHELPAEAEWISRTIGRRGGVAPAALVEEVLELHLDYVAGEPLPVDPPLDSETPASEAGQRRVVTTRAGAEANARERRPGGAPPGS